MNNQDLWEKEMEEMIRKAGEGLEIPEGLQPESIRKNLQKRRGVVLANRKKKFRSWCVAAASVCLLCGCGVVWTTWGERTTSDHEISGTVDQSKGDAEDGTDLQTTEELEKLTYAEDYQEVYRTIKTIAKRRVSEEYVVSGEAAVNINYDADGAKDSTVQKAENALTSTSHSETNVSVEGILEADQVCTDGEYIYRLRERVDGSGILEIIRADGGKMELTGKYSCGDEISPKEFFLAGDQLILLSTAGNPNGFSTIITFLDIRDRTKPVKTGKLTQTGGYSQARLQDGYLYIVSGNRAQYEKDFEQYDRPEEESLIPCVNGEPIAASQIYIPNGCDETFFTTITSVDLNDAQKFADSRSIMAGSEYLHMTEESIYFVTSQWTDSLTKRKSKGVTTKTQITKFSYQQGKFFGKATKQIKGSVRDTFAINEYQGNLRVISSLSYNKGKDDNAVYVLDEDLKIIGSIEHLAKDERVYSARFQGDIGYFVTYRETDPLFSVDFSDPTNPKILGKLKIPGFSEYMHFYNDHLLLGIGLETSNDGEREAVKLSMFDISDPTNVQEVHKTLLKDISYSTALYDYKSVLIDPARNIIGFDGWETYTDDLQYFVYSYDEEKGFVRKMRHNLSDRFGMIRGLFIEDTVYLVDLSAISLEAYDLNSGKRVGRYQKK